MTQAERASRPGTAISWVRCGGGCSGRVVYAVPTRSRRASAVLHHGARPAQLAPAARLMATLWWPWFCPRQRGTLTSGPAPEVDCMSASGGATAETGRAAGHRPAGASALTAGGTAPRSTVRTAQPRAARQGPAPRRLRGLGRRRLRRGQAHPGTAGSRPIGRPRQAVRSSSRTSASSSPTRARGSDARRSRTSRSVTRTVLRVRPGWARSRSKGVTPWDSASRSSSAMQALPGSAR